MWAGASSGDGADWLCRVQQKSFWERGRVNEQAFDVEIRRSRSAADTVASRPRCSAAPSSHTRATHADQMIPNQVNARQCLILLLRRFSVERLDCVDTVRHSVK